MIHASQQDLIWFRWNMNTPSWSENREAAVSLMFDINGGLVYWGGAVKYYNDTKESEDADA